MQSFLGVLPHKNSMAMSIRSSSHCACTTSSSQLHEQPALLPTQPELIQFLLPQEDEKPARTRYMNMLERCVAALEDLPGELWPQGHCMAGLLMYYANSGGVIAMIQFQHGM